MEKEYSTSPGERFYISRAPLEVMQPVKLPPVSKTGTARLTTRQLTALTPFAVPNDDALFLTRRKELTQEKSERRAKRRGLLAESLPPALSGTMTKAAARASRQRVSGRLRQGRGRTASSGAAVAPQGAAKDRADRDAKEDDAVRARAEEANGSAPTKTANGRVEPLSAKELARRKARHRVTIAAQRMLRTASSRVQAESRRDKDDMSSFLSKKRQMFLVQMALDVKRREMRKLQDRATDRELCLRRAELVLEEDHVRFETFLKVNNESTSAALQRCEQISQLKRERMVDIKKMVGTVQQIDTRLTKQRAAIVDCVEYQIFLSMLTPQPTFSSRGVTKRMRLDHCVALRKELRLIRANTDADTDESEFGGLALINRAVGIFRGLVKDRSVDDEAEESGGRPGTAGSTLSLLETPRQAGGFAFADAAPPATREELNAATTRLATIANAAHFPPVVPDYFALDNASTLLEIYANLEERNLFLVQNRQQSEAAIEELEQRRDVRSAANEAKIKRVLGEVANLKAAHAASRARLARCAPAASSSGGGGGGGGGSPTKAGGRGKSGAEQRAKQQQLLVAIDAHVRETYAACKFPIDSHPTTTAMCSALEGLLEELTTRVTAVRAAHPAYLVAAEKKVGKERRDRQRVERAAEEADAAEIRLIRSRARAAKPIPKRTAKPDMFRSFLIQGSDKTKTVVSEAEREAADVARFLT